jgi:hypothetical protein
MLVQVNMYDLVDYRPLCVSVSLCVCVCMYVCMYVCGACVYVCMYVVHVCMYYVCAVTCTGISPSSHLCREGGQQKFRIHVHEMVYIHIIHGLSCITPPLPCRPI